MKRGTWLQMTSFSLSANCRSTHRYVLDLIKLKGTFIDILIPPEAKDQPHVLPDTLLPTWSRQSDSSSSLASPTFDKARIPSSRSVSRATTAADDVDHLPIAAQFSTVRSMTSAQDLGEGNDNPRQLQSDLHESPPRRQGGTHEDGVDVDATIRISRTYHYLATGQPPTGREDENAEGVQHSGKSLPPARRPSMGLHSGHFDASPAQNFIRLPSSKPSRHSLNAFMPATSPTRHSRLSSNIRKRISSVTSSADTDSPLVVPEDLRIVLQVIGNSILKGHLALSDALRKRYDEQYPLVRSLADIFIEHVRACFSFASSVNQSSEILLVVT